MILFLKVARNEIRKEILTALSFKMQWLGELTALLIFYFFLSQIPHKIEMSTESYCLWFYSVLLIGDISGKVSTEMQSGTLEQIYLSVYSPALLFFAKMIASIVKATLIMSLLFCLLEISSLSHFTNIFTFKFISIITLLTPALFGISLIIGGITLLFKESHWMLNILNNATLFLSGAFIPLTHFPPLAQKIASCIPTVQAIQLMQNHNAQSSHWLLLLLMSITYLTFGWLLFYLCEGQARAKGILGHY